MIATLIRHLLATIESALYTTAFIWVFVVGEITQKRGEEDHLLPLAIAAVGTLIIIGMARFARRMRRPPNATITIELASVGAWKISIDKESIGEITRYDRYASPVVYQITDDPLGQSHYFGTFGYALGDLLNSHFVPE